MPGFIDSIEPKQPFVEGFAKAIRDQRSVTTHPPSPAHPSCPPELEEDDPHKNTLKKIFHTDNPPVFPWLEAVYVLSGRTSVLGRDVDKLQRPFDPHDDRLRMELGIKIADEINALLAGKDVASLTDADRVIPIFYNGRPEHNEDLRTAIGQKLLSYPAHLFVIREINPMSTIGQADSFNTFLKESGIRHAAVVSSGFHLARAGLTFSSDSPRAKKENGEPNALGETTLVFYGIDRHFQRPGTDIDITKEPEAMANYATGFGGTKPPSIAAEYSKNVFLTARDILCKPNWRTREKERKLQQPEGCIMS